MRVGLILALIALVAAAAGAEARLPRALKEVGFDQRLDAQVPLATVFRNETNRPVSLADYVHDKPVILVLVQYRCPMLCNLVLNGLTQAMRDLSFDAGRQFEVVTVSFDPRETAELAREKQRTYVQRYGRPGAAGGWHFLTGDEEAITALTRAVGFRFHYDPAQDRFAHASGIILLTPAGRVSRYFYDVKYSPRDVRLGLVEASQNKIGSPIDKILLFCFHYDPAEGKYGAAVMRLVRLGGVVTLVCVVAGLWILVRRGPRSAPADSIGEPLIGASGAAK